MTLPGAAAWSAHFSSGAVAPSTRSGHWHAVPWSSRPLTCRRQIRRCAGNALLRSFVLKREGSKPSLEASLLEREPASGPRESIAELLSSLWDSDGLRPRDRYSYSQDLEGSVGEPRRLVRPNLARRWIRLAGHEISRGLAGRRRVSSRPGRTATDAEHSRSLRRTGRHERSDRAASPVQVAAGRATSTGTRRCSRPIGVPIPTSFGWATRSRNGS